MKTPWKHILTLFVAGGKKIFARGRIALAVLLVSLPACGAAVAVAAQGDNAPGEYQVKAAILYNFAKFVEWPADAFPLSSAPILIGILGDDPFGSAFDVAREKLIKGRKVRVIRSGDTRNLTLSHVLFISASERGRLSSVLKEFQGAGTLLVSDINKFAARGGMVGLVMRNDMVDFEINVDAVQRSGLRISERLLNTARIVRDAKP